MPRPSETTGDRVVRIVTDFCEVPDLSVSATEAGDLWGIDDDICREILEALVAAGFLRRTPRGWFRRAGIEPDATGSLSAREGASLQRD